jgi:hypothetical protein
MRGRQVKGSKEMRGGIKQQGGSRGGLKGKQGHQEKGNWSTRRKESWMGEYYTLSLIYN